MCRSITLIGNKNSKKHSDELLDFVRVNTKTMSDSELSEAINKQFNLSTTRESVKSMRLFHRIMKGRENCKYHGCYTCAVYEERQRKNDYVQVKIGKNKWVNKQNFLYEQAHGKVPKGYCVIFLDGNINNFSLDNLAAVAVKEQLALSRYKLRFSNPDLTKTGISIVKLKNKIRARKGNEKNA